MFSTLVSVSSKNTLHVHFVLSLSLSLSLSWLALRAQNKLSMAFMTGLSTFMLILMVASLPFSQPSRALGNLSLSLNSTLSSLFIPSLNPLLFLLAVSLVGFQAGTTMAKQNKVTQVNYISIPIEHQNFFFPIFFWFPLNKNVTFFCFLFRASKRVLKWRKWIYSREMEIRWFWGVRMKSQRGKFQQGLTLFTITKTLADLKTIHLQKGFKEVCQWWLFPHDIDKV